MIKIREAVVVEGKYDKIRLESMLDTVIVTTDGFGIFRDKEKLSLLRRLAESRGLLILTDSDSAGFLIRGHLTGVISPSLIKHAYIPEILGKERRKSAPSKEGTLGVEGMSTEVLLSALERAGVMCGAAEPPCTHPITREDFFADGLSGGTGSSEKRGRLLSALGLPSKMSSKALLNVINSVTDYESYKEIMKTINEQR